MGFEGATARLTAVGLSIGLAASSAWARKPKPPTLPSTPSIEQVVAAEGFTPTPSQSEIYRPGTVLVPNGHGGHDVVVEHCVAAEPAVSVMSQSSIATPLSGGVTARLTAVKGSVSAGIEKRLSFVDPEQRTISLGVLNATQECAEQVENAARFQDLSGAIVLHDVLVAVVKNTVCTKADAPGAMIAIGATEAAAYSECVQESDGQVPLGYKAVPLKLLLQQEEVAGRPLVAPNVGSNRPATVQSSVAFQSTGDPGVEAKLKQQRCLDDARTQGEQQRTSRLSAAGDKVRSEATQAWLAIESKVTACLDLPLRDRSPCIDAVASWIGTARAMPLHLPAGEETIETECGPVSAAFEGTTQSVRAREYDRAVSLLQSLTKPPAEIVEIGVSAIDNAFMPAQEILDDFNRASASLHSVNANIVKAMGLAEDSAVADAIGMMKAKAAGKFKVEVRDFKPRVTVTDDAGEDVKAAVQAINDGGPVMADAIQTLAAIREQAKAVVDAAKAVPSAAPAALKEAGLKPAELPGKLKAIGGNVKAVGGIPGAAKGTMEAAKGNIDLIKGLAG